MPNKLLITFLMIVCLVLAACGGGDTPTDADGAEGSSTHLEGDVAGAAAEPAEATRKIPIEASDDLRFDPASIEVQRGDVVTFVVRNVGKTDHEFVLGDRAYQEEHETDVEEGGHGMEMGNAVTVTPGETKELTWRFTESGEVLYGCHEPGHYEGGMIGTIAVT